MRAEFVGSCGGGRVMDEGLVLVRDCVRLGRRERHSWGWRTGFPVRVTKCGNRVEATSLE